MLKIVFMATNRFVSDVEFSEGKFRQKKRRNLLVTEMPLLLLGCVKECVN